MRHLGFVAWEQGDLPQGQKLFQKAASNAQRCQDWREFGLALIRLAGCLIDRRELKEGKSTALRALSIGEEVEDRYIQGFAAYWISVAESKEGDLESSLEWLDKGEIWARELGWSRALTWYLLRRG
jgi:hypothetical protein